MFIKNTTFFNKYGNKISSLKRAPLFKENCPNTTQLTATIFKHGNSSRGIHV